MSQAVVALNTARTLLNDDGSQLWTDPVLMPKLQAAHRELQIQMRANACPVTRDTTSALPVPANATTVTAPTDMVEPITLWEKDGAEPDSLYVRMTEYDPLPVVARGNRLIWWRWAKESFEFVGSTVNRTIKIYYKRSITIPASATDPIGIIDGELYLGPRVAALAFGSTGNATAAGWCSDMAMSTLNDILIANRGRARMVQRP